MLFTYAPKRTHAHTHTLKVAEGAAHIYPRLAPTSEWDTCAAQAIVECAGGKVLQAEGGIACE
jgi:3'(2'), 5'-bisphosphate nucleotidase